jgi:hypothetical protein
MYMDSSGPLYGLVVGSFEHCNEHSGFIKTGEVLDNLSDSKIARAFICSIKVAV